MVLQLPWVNDLPSRQINGFFTYLPHQVFDCLRLPYHSKSYSVKVYLGFEGVDPGPKSRPVIFVVVAVSIGCQIHSLLLFSSPQVCFDNQLFSVNGS